MGERTKYEPGTFSWVDLATPDPEGAKRFYGRLFGWEAEDVPTGETGVYTMCRVGGSNVAAMMQQGDEEREQGIPPHWNNYVTVANVDDSAAKAAELGGTVVAPPFDVMDVGRMAVIQDPTGAFLMLWEARSSIGAELVNEPGCLTWNDLNTNDPERAFEFYSGLFGWSEEQMRGSDGGVDYRVVRNGDRTNGGIMQSPVEGVPSHWLPYFAVDSVDRTIETAESEGGTKHAGPMDVPNGGRIAVLADPQGAAFAIYEGEFDD